MTLEKLEDREWLINTKYKCELFKCFRPMLSGRYNIDKIIELIKTREYICETKYDGERI